MNTIDHINDSKRHALEELLASCEISDSFVQRELIAFVTEEREIDSEVEKMLNVDPMLQEFVERAFAIEFAPLQGLLGDE